MQTRQTVRRSHGVKLSTLTFLTHESLKQGSNGRKILLLVLRNICKESTKQTSDVHTSSEGA